MTTLASVLDLLADVVPVIDLLAGDPERSVTEVRLIEELDQLDETGPGTLVIFDRGLSMVADGYLLDVAVRRAVSRNAAAIMLLLPATVDVSMTAVASCRKTGLALVRLTSVRDVSAVLQVIARQVADEFHLSVEKARRAMAAIARLGDQGASVAELARLGSRLLGLPITVGTVPEDEDERRGLLVVPAVITGRTGEYFRTDRLADADANTLLEMVLWRLSAEASRTLLAADETERISLLSVGEVLRQLVDAEGGARDDLSPLARKLGIPIDGWHILARIELDNLPDISATGMLAYQQRERLARTALATASAGGGTWHVAQDPAALLLMFSSAAVSDRNVGRRVQRQLTDVLLALHQLVPELRMFAGIGGLRAGATGVAGSATEAKLATALARSQHRPGYPVSFDAVGLRSTLVEWFGSPTVQRSIDALFAPLAKLTEPRRESTIAILGTYLDLGGSVARTADAVHLHRNAVRARVQRALELLDVDLDNADQRLFLHLACRARMPTPGRTAGH